MSTSKLDLHTTLGQLQADLLDQLCSLRCAAVILGYEPADEDSAAACHVLYRAVAAVDRIVNGLDELALAVSPRAKGKYVVLKERKE
jgi:hypothetical protein